MFPLSELAPLCGKQVSKLAIQTAYSGLESMRRLSAKYACQVAGIRIKNEP
jgi:hypothetical protein